MQQSWVVDSDLLASAQDFEAVLNHAPGDLFALKRSQLMYFLIGKRQDMLRVSTPSHVICP